MQQDLFLNIFALPVRQVLERAKLDYGRLQELRLRACMPLLVLYEGEEFFLLETGALSKSSEAAYRVTEQDLLVTLQCLGKYSLYAFEDEIRQGFLTVPGGHRIGIAGQVVMDGGKIRSIKHVSCMNVRLAHEKRGCADKIMPYVVDNNRICNCLIISPPGCGKTTMLRDMIRQISNGWRSMKGKTVGVVDERSEIGGCYLGVPQNDLGMRTDVLDCCPKAEGMMMLIRSMAPDVVAVDEIGDYADAHALESVISCGCRLFATVHGSSIEDIQKKPLLDKMMKGHVFQRYIILDRYNHVGNLNAVFDSQGNLLHRGEGYLCQY